MQPAVLLFPVPVQPDTVLNIVGTTYTLLSADEGQWLQTLNAAPVVVTLSSDLAGGWPDAAELVLQRGGAGQVTLTPAPGVTIHTAGGLVLTTNYSTLQLKRVGPNNWVAVNSGGGGGGGASQFIQLTDVPPDYATFGGQLVRVRAAETGLEFADNLARLGINIGPDATHRFAVKSPAALFTAIPAAESGDGDFRLRINKELLGDLAVLDFMQGLVAKGRIGLAFDNALHIMTTPDGTNFQDGINIDPTTGTPDLNMASQTIASAATTDIGLLKGMRATISGTTTITSLGTAANRLRFVGFAAALTLTHNATTLVLPGGANIQTAAGDTAIFSSDGAGNWRCRQYLRAAASPDSQPLDADLTAIAALSGTGLAVRTAADTWALRTLVAPAEGIGIANPAGIGGNITVSLTNDLAAVEALVSAGIVVRTAADAWTTRSMTAPAAGLTITNPAGLAGAMIFALANDLAALEALAATGLAVRTGADTWAQRSIAVPAAGIGITNADGAAGNPTLSLTNDLGALEALAGTGIAVRSAADTWVQRSLAAPAAGFTITNPAGIAGNFTFVLADDLAAVEALATFGMVARTALNTWTTRSIAITAGQGSIANADGVAGNPTISLATALVALAALTPAADQAPYFTSGTAAALMTVTAFIRTLLDDTTQAAAQATLGVDATTLDARYLRLVGGTLTGNLTIDNGSALIMNGPVASNVGTIYRKAGLLRWFNYMTGGTEPGGNVGSDWVNARYDDAGNFIDTPFYFTRSTGIASMALGVSVSGAGYMIGASVVIDANRHFNLRVYTIATLPAAPGAGQYEAACSDLGGGAGAVDWDGSKWRRRSDGGTQTVATDADFTLTTLTSAPQQVHTGTLTANRTITLSTTNAYNGARFRVTRTGVGAFNLSVGGLKNLVQNSWADVVYNGSAWVLAAAGTL